MAMVLADVGAAKVLEAYFNNSWPTSKDLTLKLFVNDVTPDDTYVAGDLTEAADGGYAAKTLTNGSWTVSKVSNIEQAAYAQQTWTFTGALNGGATVYGWYIVDDDGTLIFAERNSVSFTPAVSGDTIKVTPTIQLSKGTPT